MNLFILDENPEKAARLNCNRHVCKIILEAAQLLTLAHYSVTPKKVEESEQLAKYCPLSQYNHPVTKWVRASVGNYRWAARHGMELCREYTYRYYKVHKTANLMYYLAITEPPLPNIGQTPFAQAMPDEYKDPDTVIAYIQYYLGEKRFAQWKGRPKPLWWV